MCWCNPIIRTPQCRSINCIPPTKQEVNVGTSGHPDWWPYLPQTDMFDKEMAIELLKKAGILDEDGKLKGTYKS